MIAIDFHRCRFTGGSSEERLAAWCSSDSISIEAMGDWRASVSDQAVLLARFVDELEGLGPQLVRSRVSAADDELTMLTRNAAIISERHAATNFVCPCIAFRR
jgi:hypothetical protein